MSPSVPQSLAVPSIAILAMTRSALAENVPARSIASFARARRLKGLCSFASPFAAVALLYAGTTVVAVVLAAAGNPDAVGYLASLFVLSSFASRSMVSLRVLALLSNAAFMLYAYDHHLPPVLFLHALLLPVNVVRLWQHLRATPSSA